MNGELLNAAYEELEKLREQKPSWEVFQKISVICGSLPYLLNSFEKDTHATTIDMAIDSMLGSVGAHATIDFLKQTLNELYNDMNIIDTRMAETLMNKITRGNV